MRRAGSVAWGALAAGVASIIAGAGIIVAGVVAAPAGWFAVAIVAAGSSVATIGAVVVVDAVCGDRAPPRNPCGE